MNLRIGMAAALLIGALATSVGAATVSCVGTGRTFSIDTTPVSTCAAVAALGAHNISGNPSGANPDPLFALLGPGLILLDKSDDLTSGTNPLALSGLPSLVAGLSGSFSFDINALVASAGNEYYKFILAFKSGGNKDKISAWAAFALADGVSSGTWAISGKNGLSHVNLYAYERPVAVPLPAGGLLLIGALGGLAALRRKRKIA